MLSLLGLIFGLFSSGAPATASPVPLDQVADLPLPGHPSRFDYQWLDPVNRRLYIAHLGDSSLVVFDLDGQRVIQEVSGLASVHGVVAAPDQHQLFATATADKTLVLIDDKTFEIQARVHAGEYPNGLAYEPKSGRVFVSNNSGPGVGVVDVKTAHALPGIDVGGGAGNTQYDAESGHVLAAVHGRAVLADIDPASLRVASRITLSGISTCHGLLVASGWRLAFAACRGAAGPTMVVVDLRARKQLQSLPLPADIDVLAFDSGLARLYAASESGIVAVFSLGSDRALTELGRGFVGPNAHSVAVDPVTHRVYFPIANLSGRPVLRIMNPMGGPPAP